jgi:hypothetical protein
MLLRDFGPNVFKTYGWCVLLYYHLSMAYYARELHTTVTVSSMWDNSWDCTALSRISVSFNQAKIRNDRNFS